MATTYQYYLLRVTLTITTLDLVYETRPAAAAFAAYGVYV